MQRTAPHLTAIVILAVAAPLLGAAPAAADSWHYFEGQRSKGTQYERLYVREQGKNRKKVTAYWELRHSDAGPICYKGRQDKNPDFYRVYHGTWKAETFPYGKWVEKPTTFYYNRLSTPRKAWGTWGSKVTPQNGGWMREQVWTGLPSNARWCFG